MELRDQTSSTRTQIVTLIYLHALSETLQKQNPGLPGLRYSPAFRPDSRRGTLDPAPANRDHGRTLGNVGTGFTGKNQGGGGRSREQNQLAPL